MTNTRDGLQRNSPGNRLSSRIATMCAALTCAVAALSCGDQLTEPRTSRPFGTPDFALAPAGNWSIPVPPNNSQHVPSMPSGVIDLGGVPYTNTGVSIPRGGSFRVTVTGNITLSPNPDHVALFGAYTTYSSSGAYGPEGSGRAWAELAVYAELRDPNGSRIGVTLRKSGSSVVSDTIYAPNGGQLWIGRGGVWGQTCQGSTCAGMYAMSGSQTVLVERVTDILKLTADPTGARSATQVTFTPSRADGQSITSTPTWWWEPDAGASGDSTRACAAGSNPCRTVVYRSGTMHVTADVGGKVRDAAAHVAIYSNFTLDVDKPVVSADDVVVFTPHADGLPIAAARWRWVPRISGAPTDPGCPAGATECRRLMVWSGTMWAYTNASPGTGDSASAAVVVRPRVTVVCSSRDGSLSPVIRGQEIDCATSIYPAQAFNVAQRWASPKGSPPITATAGRAYQPGESDHWQGIAVVSTDVQVDVTTVDAQATGRTVFEVGPRPWSPWQLSLPVEVHALIGDMTAYPHPIGPAGKIEMGQFNEFDLSLESISVASVPNGPDSGLMYVASQPPAPQPIATIHPALFPGHPFYADQNGNPPGTCTAADIDRYRDAVRRHEGATGSPDSHWGKANQALLEMRPDTLIEAVVGGDSVDVKITAQYAYYEWRTQKLHPLYQAPFDSTDYPNVNATLGGCAFDFVGGYP